MVRKRTDTEINKSVEDKKTENPVLGEGADLVQREADVASHVDYISVELKSEEATEIEETNWNGRGGRYQLVDGKKIPV